MEKIILNEEQTIDIKNVIKSSGLTHIESTRRCGVSYSYFEQMINGKRFCNQKFALFVKTIDQDLYKRIFPDKYNIYPKKSAADLSSFLQNSKTKWYWMGFLLADGHFTDRGISLSLSIKDAKHLEKFRQFVGHRGVVQQIVSKSPNSDKLNKCVRVWAGGADTVLHLKKEFGINSNKTYNPPAAVSTKSPEKIISLFIGLVDGDGSIPKRKRIGNATIEMCMHRSWETYVKTIVEIIFDVCGEVYNHHPYYDKATFRIQISNPIVTKFLKKKADEFKIPYLKRKWDNIHANQVGRYEIRRRREKLLPSLINQGHSLQNIADILDMYKSNVCRMIKRLELRTPHKR